MKRVEVVKWSNGGLYGPKEGEVSVVLGGNEHNFSVYPENNRTYIEYFRMQFINSITSDQWMSIWVLI